jgi:hypothetical protein
MTGVEPPPPCKVAAPSAHLQVFISTLSSSVAFTVSAITFRTYLLRICKCFTIAKQQDMTVLSADFISTWSHMKCKTKQRLAAAATVTGVVCGMLAQAAEPAHAATYLSVSLSSSSGPYEGVAYWNSAGNPVLSFDTAGAFVWATVNVNNVPETAPTEAPSFTTDNYSDDSPVWLIEFTDGGWLYGYPSNAGLGTANWEAARGNCSSTTLTPTYGTYTDMLAVLARDGCGGNVTSAQIYASGNQYPAIDTITNIQYNGETLAPGPGITVVNPGSQTGNVGTPITPLFIKAYSVKGDTIGSYDPDGLPPGLSIAGNGEITGTPTKAGTFTVTILAFDDAISAGQATFRWQINPKSSETYSGTIRLTKMGLCLDDRNNNPRNGAVVQVWQCNGLASQKWQVWSDGTIRHNGLCLDAENRGTANGTKVQLWNCTGAANQKWDTKSYRIHYDNPAAVNKVLDDTGHGGNGTQQQIWTNTGGANQIWATS